MYVMLNPSTADGAMDDPTIKKCIGFAMNAGYGGFVVHNLFSYRATYERDLYYAKERIYDGYDKVLLEDALAAKVICVAWGSVRKDYLERVEQVRAMLSSNLFCLGVNPVGKQPRHPLYVPYKQKFEEWQ